MSTAHRLHGPLARHQDRPLDAFPGRGPAAWTWPLLAIVLCLAACDPAPDLRSSGDDTSTQEADTAAQQSKLAHDDTAVRESTQPSATTVATDEQTPNAAKGNPVTDPTLANDTSPDTFTARFETTKGPVDILVERSWAPLGADRFYNLVKHGFFNEIGMFRVVKGFVVQFGIHGDPKISQAWRAATIEDDQVVKSNTRGTLTFATSGKHSRTTQLFINYGDNSNLDRMGFSPIGKVIGGMSVIDDVFDGYGETPDQGQIQNQGNDYLKQSFPQLDYIKSATIVK